MVVPAGGSQPPEPASLAGKLLIGQTRLVIFSLGIIVLKTSLCFFLSVKGIYLDRKQSNSDFFLPALATVLSYIQI